MEGNFPRLIIWGTIVQASVVRVAILLEAIVWVAIIRVAVILGSNCPGEQLSWRAIILEGNSPGGNCLGGGEFSRGQLSGGNCPRTSMDVSEIKQPLEIIFQGKCAKVGEWALEKLILMF